MSQTYIAPKKNAYLQEMSENDKEINHKIIKNINKRVNYLKNPRYKVNKHPILFSYMNTKQDIVTEKDAITSIRVFPKQCIFRDYMINGLYEMDLVVTNASKLLQRIKYMPPSKIEFQIASIKYPSTIDGTIASGMSAIFKIRFNPSSLAEFDDEIAIITEDHILKVPLLARKEPPQLDLPSLLDCQSCWLGDQVQTSFHVTNSGGEAGYRFFVNGQNDDEEDENYIHIGNFMITPAEFYLQKGESQEIHAIFKPDKEGEIHESIILRCDNQTQATLELVGKGNMVELSVVAIDNKPLDFLIEKIFFNLPIPNYNSQRVLSVLNKTSVKVKYHWSIQRELDLGDDKDNYYLITPESGFFEAHQKIDFQLQLNSHLYFPLFENIALIIDEIPLESIRNPPASLTANTGVVIGTNSLKPSITYYEFELASVSALTTVKVTPPFYIFPQKICVEGMAKHKFILQTDCKCPLKYTVEQLTDPSLSLIECGTELQNQSEITLGLKSSRVGLCEVKYLIHFDYADSILITLQAHIVAPEIEIDLPWLDYGLIQTYSLESKTITIKNISAVSAIVHLGSISDQRLSFFRESFEIQPYQSVQQKIDFNSSSPETYHDFLSVEVKDGNYQVLEVFAEVQTPSVSLNRLSLDIETLYCGNTYTFDQRAQQYIMLQNLGNIPTPYEWLIPSTDKYIVQFEPRKGILKAKSNQVVKFSIKPRQGGPLNELFVCEVQGLQYPIGFEMNSLVHGLSVEYELIDDAPHVSSKHSVTSKKSLANTRTQITQEVPQIKNQAMERLDFFGCIINKPKQMKFLLKNTSGIHTQFTLSMRKYQPHALDQESTIQDDFDGKSYKSGARTIKFAESSISKSVNKKGKLTQSGRPVVLLTNKIEKTQNFTSEAGQMLNKIKKMEHDQRVYLSNNMGIAVVFEPPTGTLSAYGSAVVQVTVFNDICGLYDDVMICEIRGLEPKEFPMKIEIKGSPIVVSPNQLGFQYKDLPSFALGTFMRHQGLVTREFRVMNTGPQDVELEWKIYNLGNNTSEDIFDIKITDPPLGSEMICDVQFIANIPPESHEPFQITPQHEKIKGRKEKHFSITFDTKDSGIFSACLVAKPRMLSSEQPIGEIALYISSETITPRLYFDKLERANAKGHQVKFQKWSSGFNKRQQKRVVLVNRQKSSLLCNFEITGQFKIIKTSTNSPQKFELANKTGINHTFNLVQNSHVELEILFEGYPIDSPDWPLTYKVYNEGQLKIYFSNGDEQVIDLEGVLLRPFIALNTSGIDGVEGTDVIDFGSVQEELRLPIYITNLSTVPASWKLQHQKNPLRKNIVLTTMTLLDKEEQAKTDDPSVFSFQLSEGLLQGPSTMVHTLPHATALPYQITVEDINNLGITPLQILVSFKPTQPILYKSKYRIKVQDGPYVEFTLKGTGLKNIKT